MICPKCGEECEYIDKYAEGPDDGDSDYLNHYHQYGYLCRKCGNGNIQTDIIKSMRYGLFGPGECDVFDWEKAINLMVEHDMKNVEAFLEGDYLNTVGSILLNGEPAGGAQFLSSRWATPTMKDLDTGRTYVCSCKESEAKFGDNCCWTDESEEYFDKLLEIRQ